jgi:hypothetical protein
MRLVYVGRDVNGLGIKAQKGISTYPPAEPEASIIAGHAKTQRSQTAAERTELVGGVARGSTEMH